jgi:UDP-3-O-[3-hydroxymyristoyl] glucosamine N-acyltransferase
MTLPHFVPDPLLDTWPVRLGRAARAVATSYRLRHCAKVGRHSMAVGHVWIHGSGRIVLGERVWLDASTAPIELHCFSGAEIEIGDDVVIEGGTSIEAMRSISIGAGSHIGMHCKIIDGNFHPLDRERGEVATADAVIIQAGVSLEPHSIVVAGRLGENALVGARTVITRRVRPNAQVRGFPAVCDARRNA